MQHSLIKLIIYLCLCHSYIALKTPFTWKDTFVVCLWPLRRKTHLSFVSGCFLKQGRKWFSVKVYTYVCIYAHPPPPPPSPPPPLPSSPPQQGSCQQSSGAEGRVQETVRQVHCTEALREGGHLGDRGLAKPPVSERETVGSV